MDTTRIIEPITTEITDKTEMTDNIIENTAITIKTGHTITTIKTATTTITREEAGITKIRTEITKEKTRNIILNTKVKQKRTKERVVTHPCSRLHKKCYQLIRK